MKHNQSAARKSHTLIPADDLPDLMAICPRCGGEVELWSEDEETICIFCGQKIFERATATH